MRWLVWVSLHQRLGYLQARLRRICLILLHYLHFWLLDAYGRISTRRTVIIQKQYITYQLIYESAYFIPRERYRIGCEVSKSVIKINVIPHDCEMCQRHVLQYNSNNHTHTFQGNVGCFHILHLLSCLIDIAISPPLQHIQRRTY